MLANRRIEKNQCNIKNTKTELKSAIGINSGIEIWDWNQMLRAQNNLHLKWQTRSNMSVQRRNGQNNMDSSHGYAQGFTESTNIQASSSWS